MVLEAAELFIDVVHFCSERRFNSCEVCFSSLRKSVISSCTLARCVPNAKLTMSLISFKSLLLIREKYTMRARKRGGLAARLGGLDQADNLRQVKCWFSHAFLDDSERMLERGWILDHFILFHPDIEFLDFGNPKVL